MTGTKERLAYIVTPCIRFILRRLCRVYDDELGKLPPGGPAIFIVNHINFLEVPLLYTHLQPRRIVGLVKAETWKNKFLGFLGDIWNAIPIDRKSAGIGAFKAALSYLHNGRIVMIAPEGTRSKNGRLLPGRPGVVLLAMKSRVKIYPIAHFGGEKFWNNLKSFRRTRFYLRVGTPFEVNNNGRVNSNVRQKITDEMMYRIAELLPRHLRGCYGDFKRATTEYLVFSS